MLASTTSMSMTACLLVASEGPPLLESAQKRSPSATSSMLAATLIRPSSGQLHWLPCMPHIPMHPEASLRVCATAAISLTDLLAKEDSVHSDILKTSIMRDTRCMRHTRTWLSFPMLLSRRITESARQQASWAAYHTFARESFQNSPANLCALTHRQLDGEALIEGEVLERPDGEGSAEYIAGDVEGFLKHPAIQNVPLAGLEGRELAQGGGNAPGHAVAPQAEESRGRG